MTGQFKFGSIRIAQNKREKEESRGHLVVGFMVHLKLSYRVCFRTYQVMLKGSSLRIFSAISESLHTHRGPLKAAKSEWGGCKRGKDAVESSEILASSKLSSVSGPFSFSWLGILGLHHFISSWVSNLYLHFKPLSKASVSHVQLPLFWVTPSLQSLSQATISFFPWLPYFKEPHVCFWKDPLRNLV